jgi:hypothetical protein
MAVTHDMARFFGVVDAVPVKTDEGSGSHRARHGTGKRREAAAGFLRAGPRRRAGTARG